MVFYALVAIHVISHQRTPGRLVVTSFPGTLQYIPYKRISYFDNSSWETIKLRGTIHYRPQTKFGARQCFYTSLSFCSLGCLPTGGGGRWADPPEPENRAVRIPLECFLILPLICEEIVSCSLN